MTIFQGDNTAAFGGNLLTINISTESGIIPTIKRAELKIGCIFKTFNNPVFPITLNLTEEETSKLQTVNYAYLAVWDINNRKKTCEGTVAIQTSPRRV